MSPDQIKARLVEAFPGATALEVQDLTGTEDHYQVYVCSPDFEGLSRVARHQKVMAAFDAELKSGEVHALSIRAETPVRV